MKTRTIEFAKLMLISLLSIGLFSAAFIGFNHLIFSAATAEPTPLIPLHQPVVGSNQPIAAHEQAQYNAALDASIFTAPSLIVFASPHQHYHAIPAAAMPMEQAAQIGARYIWDVFQTNIDGMYVEMLFSAHASHSRSHWSGTVRAEWFDFADMADDDFDARIAMNDAMLFQFSIDAVTGQRVDISSFAQPRRTVQDLHIDESLAERTLMMEADWFNLTLDAQLQILGVTDEVIANYIAVAQQLGNAHFDTFGLTGALRAVRTQMNNEGRLVLAVIQYIVTYNNREAIINVPTAAALFAMYRVETGHNDFIPGFYFHDDGRGRG